MTGDTGGTGLTAALILGALTFKGIDLIKYLIILVSRGNAESVAGKTARSDALNGLLTLALGGVIGVVIVWSMASTGIAEGIKVGASTLSGLDAGSKIALGLAMTSLAGVLFDGKKALDNSDSASKGKLLSGADERRQKALNARTP